MFGFGKDKEKQKDNIFDDNAVNPIAEADVYFAYGRDAKAIEILQEAYFIGDSELNSRIEAYIAKNNKESLFYNKEDTKDMENKTDKKHFKYRVHWTYYVNGFSEGYKLNVLCNNPKDSDNGLMEIENYIEKYMSKKNIADPSNWVINFISESLL